MQPAQTPTVPLQQEFDKNEANNRALIEAMVTAFNSRDLPTIMSLLTEDCLYEHHRALFGNVRVYKGKDAIQPIFAKLLSQHPDQYFENPKIWMNGNEACASWDFVIPAPNPYDTTVRLNGLDIFLIREGKIALKRTWIRRETSLSLMAILKGIYLGVRSGVV